MLRTLFIAISLLTISSGAMSQAVDSTAGGPSLSTMPPWAMAGSSPMSTPGMTGPITANPRPISYKAGLLGNLYITGVASGIGQWQNSVFPGDHELLSDVTNGQIFVQKTDGVIQYFLQVGVYSLPDLGVPYSRAAQATNAFYGVFPQGFIKIAPTKNFSLTAGKLPTLIGAEYTFTFENMNIQRGLLWNQENAVNRGVQVNYTTGPLTFAVSWNDGFYSQKYTWAWFSATYAANSSNTIAFIGSGNTQHDSISTAATPLYQNNEQLYNLIYTHTSGRWTVEPYLQYTYIPRIPKIGVTIPAATYGAALFVNYSAYTNTNGSNFNLPVRLEYITSAGSEKGAPNLIYGTGSSAWSFTVTPTYQYNRIFGRAEFSFVEANKITDGFAFGPDGNNPTQARLLLEIGMIF